MTEAKRLEKVIITNLRNICLNGDKEEWIYMYSYRDEYKFLKQNVSIYFREYTSGSDKKGNYVIFCLHRSEPDADRSDGNNQYNVTFKKEIKINFLHAIFSPSKFKLYLKRREVKKYNRDKKILESMKEAFNSLPISIIRKEKLEKIK